MKYFSLWAQGREAAPPLVRTVFAAWEKEVGAENVVVLEARDLDRHMEELGGFPVSVSLAHLSDLLRLKLLNEEGGVWFDASVLPMPGASDWVRENVTPTGFFALRRPGPDRPLAMNFLAATQGHLLTENWLHLMRDFWSRPRRSVESRPKSLAYLRWRRRAKADPRWGVAPNEGGSAPFHAYFANHYLFDHLLATDEAARDAWNQTPAVSALLSHVVQRCQSVADKEEFLRLAPRLLAACPVHKLDWKRPPPEAFLDYFRV